MTHYRVVCFDRKAKFSTYYIVDSLDDAIKKKNEWLNVIGIKHDYHNYVQIFKCNAKGNNYTHREVYV